MSVAESATRRPDAAEASITIDGARHDFPVRKATLGPDVIDIGALYQDTGHFTYDPGFMSTASCESKITLIDRSEQVRGAGEEAARCARVLEVAPVGDREAHVGGLAGDTELVEQPFEVGVVAVVEDDEAGVDPVAAALALDLDRVRVAAGAGTGLIDDQLVLGVQQMGGDEPRDAGSDDRDLHCLLTTQGPRLETNSVQSAQFRYANGMRDPSPAAICPIPCFQFT